VLDDAATDVATTANDIFDTEDDIGAVERIDGADASSMRADVTIFDTEICTGDAGIVDANSW